MFAGQVVLHNLFEKLQKALDEDDVEKVQGYSNAANQLTAALERTPE